MNSLHFFQIMFLQDEEKITNNISKPLFKNITRNKDNSRIDSIIKSMILHCM